MKIKYFSYMAEQSFRTTPNGERLFFHPGAFWARPYIVPNQETELRLFKKLLWMWRIFFGGLIVSALILPDLAFITTPLGFVFLFLGVMSLGFLMSWLAFRKDIQILKHASSRVPIFDFHYSAKHQSTFWLVLGLLGCSGFIWVGSSMITDPSSAFVGWVSIIVFGFFGILGGYTLFLKLVTPKDHNGGDNKTEA
jgi:hypothetical protein